MTNLQIDGYEIIRKLGEGGMAQVYLARDIALDREVAIKVLPAFENEKEDLRKRFRREAKTIAKLEHRAIVPVFDYGEGNQVPYLAMRYMRGGSLADKLEQGPLSLARAVGILDRIADGLDKAHEAGVVHRDIKPANILFDDDDKAYLADFGIVKLANHDTTITPIDGLVGTPAYMSPEQFKETPIDGRSDIYALGIVLYEMLTGVLPYQAATPHALILQHVSGPLPRILKVNPDLPKVCDRVIKKAMAKNPKNRYQTAQAMVDGLKRTAPEPAITKTNAGQSFKGLSSKSRLLWFVLGVVLLGLLGYGGFGFVRSLMPTQVMPTTAVPLTPQPTDEPPLLATTAVPLVAVTEVVADTFTETAVPLAETAVADTPTNTPAVTPQLTTTSFIVQMETTTTNVNLYGGPSAQNTVLGLLVRGVVVEVIGKVNNDSWYEVMTEAGKEGWVDANQVAFIAGTAADVPVTWPRAVSTPMPGTTAAATPLALCSGVTIERDELGNFHVLWANYPVAADHLWLSVYGVASGDPLVYPNNIDQNDPDWAANGFTIGSWLFEQRGFPQNTTYQYILKAIDGTGAEICLVSGSFVN